MIRQTDDVQQQIKNLLLQLRSHRNLQVALDISLASRAEGTQATVTLENGNQVKATELSAVLKNPRLNVNGPPPIRGPKVTLYSGGKHTVEIPTPEGNIGMEFYAELGARGTTRLRTTIGGKVFLWVVPDGHTSIAEITAAVRSLPGKAAADRRFTLVVKADAILSVKEEEGIAR